MQERYLGDSHDFVKYALLRALSTDLSASLGVNWYLTHHDDVDRVGSKDGEKRFHLTDPKWSRWDPDLVSSLRPFAEPQARRIESIESSDVLPPSTVFYRDPVPPEITERCAWHTKALAALKDCDLVFLDPDNGLEVPSMSRRTSPKYAFSSEVTDYRLRGQAVVLIQFARQCDPIRRARTLRDSLTSNLRSDSALPVVRARTAPNLLFFVLAPPALHTNAARSIASLVLKSHGKLELVH